MTFRDNNGETHEAELLPCPFCGGEPDIVFTGNFHTRARSVVIRCTSCRVRRTDGAMNDGFSVLFARSVNYWNQRASAHAPEVG